MSRRFESGDPLRRGPRRPTAAALRAAAQRAAQSRAGADKPPIPEPPRPKFSSDEASASAPDDGPVQNYALKMCTLDELEEARYHILKFRSQLAIDPAKDFVSPIRMQRKDPRLLKVVAEEDAEMEDAGGSGGVKLEDVKAEAGEDDVKGEGDGPGNGSGGAGGDDKLERAGAGKFGNGSGNGGNGGEGGGGGRRRKRKTFQAYGGEKNAAARKLRFEENYPWIMEDFDNKNTWVSSFEATNTNAYAILTYDAASDGFKLIPIEKHYKMDAAARHATLSLEDAEEKMESKNTMSDRWLMSTLQPRSGPGINAAGPLAGLLSRGPASSSASSNANGGGASNAAWSQTRGLRTVVGSEERKHRYTLDEEMDFDDQQLFDDDEGAPLLDGPEEDLKEAEDRIKQEQLKANELMDADSDGELDNLFEDGERDKEGKQGRRMRKALRALEKNQYYDTDDEQNPYASEEDDSADGLEDALIKKEDVELGSAAAGGAGAAGGVASALGSAAGSPGMLGGRAPSSETLTPPLTTFRKKLINRDLLPRGTAVLQLPPAVLGRFEAGEWNPAAKRDVTLSPPPAADPALLTRDDVLRNIKSGETDIKQLLAALKTKLAQHADNVPRLRQYVKEVARRKDGKLILRDRGE